MEGDEKATRECEREETTRGGDVLQSTERMNAMYAYAVHTLAVLAADHEQEVTRRAVSIQSTFIRMCAYSHFFESEAIFNCIVLSDIALLLHCKYRFQN